MYYCHVFVKQHTGTCGWKESGHIFVIWVSECSIYLSNYFYSAALMWFSLLLIFEETNVYWFKGSIIYLCAIVCNACNFKIFILISLESLQWSEISKWNVEWPLYKCLNAIENFVKLKINKINLEAIASFSTAFSDEVTCFSSIYMYFVMIILCVHLRSHEEITEINMY